MLRSERRSFFRFLVLYLSSTFLLFILASGIFYLYQKHHIIDIQNFQLEIEEERIAQALHKLHGQYEGRLVYPDSPTFESAIYAPDGKYIFGTFHPSHTPQWSDEFYAEGDYLYHTHQMEPYYLGAAHLLVRAKLDKTPIHELQRTLALFLLLAGAFFTLLGIFLGRIFIKPMRESLQKMNRFIEDTTHELNTPISTILTNLELLETLYACEGKEEMRRIEIASKTLSRIYDDLSYLKLNHNYHRRIEAIDVSALLEERLAYFRSMIEAKSLKTIVTLDPCVTQRVDRNDLIRLIDNLLSNAIKYNQIEGTLRLALTEDGLIVEDTGVGIKAEELQGIRQRFTRANSSEGGFGIGLDIVQQIVQRYDYAFTIQSTYQEGTKVEVVWSKA